MTDERVCAIIYWFSSPHVLSVLPCDTRVGFADYISHWAFGPLPSLEIRDTRGSLPNWWGEKKSFSLSSVLFSLVGWLVGDCGAKQIWNRVRGFLRPSLQWQQPCQAYSRVFLLPTPGSRFVPVLVWMSSLLSRSGFLLQLMSLDIFTLYLVK